MTGRREGRRTLIYHYRPKGTCSTEMTVELDGEIVRSVRVTGGCSGNLQGICRIVEGMNADEVIRRFDGIRCGSRPTSCPDQLAKALAKARAVQGPK